jgi:hypothetical protein
MKTSQLKFKTKSQKRVVQKVLDDLVVLSEFFVIFPQKGGKGQKEWAYGLTYGMKYLIVHIAEMLDDEDATRVYQDLINWEREQRNLLNK